MTDILKAIRSVDHDPDRVARLRELSGWSRRSAVAESTRQGIAMTDDHWSVVAHLRRVHLAQGVPGEARDLSSSLDRAFHDRGGTRWLYSLFPGGPVHQGCLIAGVPEPAHSIDPASGTCY
ncbi:MAG: TusE/DsrC/DsvC family sulfur relay protein [Chromatiaceae bacterium]|nr:TusE/DsrC/DsvC family sulfur relay protein [Gammaproteobacteria bacterium]MCP5306412.1 TusE/DsrC/DsvC family sulfur relay protein [Chromatiaceae bacterium]MCP5311964.1 TusE/DsrC/DsvC family sulfur relay protein [Chromatiaceae bacterium]